MSVERNLGWKSFWKFKRKKVRFKTKKDREVQSESQKSLVNERNGGDENTCRSISLRGKHREESTKLQLVTTKEQTRTLKIVWNMNDIPSWITI